MQHDNTTQGVLDCEARARLLARLAAEASDASIASAQRQLARGYALLAQWRQQHQLGKASGRDPAEA